jgi:CRP-like cAMP-binding protein
LKRVELTAAEVAALVDRLAEIEGLRDAPRHEREWLVAHGELRRYDAGEIVVGKSQDVTDMMVMLAGRTKVYLDHGTGRRHVIEAPAGTVTALLPYSRLARP